MEYDENKKKFYGIERDFLDKVQKKQLFDKKDRSTVKDILFRN
jgi:hypothetical protein